SERGRVYSSKDRDQQEASKRPSGERAHFRSGTSRMVFSLPMSRVWPFFTSHAHTHSKKPRSLIVTPTTTPPSWLRAVTHQRSRTSLRRSISLVASQVVVSSNWSRSVSFGVASTLPSPDQATRPLKWAEPGGRRLSSLLSNTS